MDNNNNLNPETEEKNEDTVEPKEENPETPDDLKAPENADASENAEASENDESKPPETPKSAGNGNMLRQIFFVCAIAALIIIAMIAVYVATKPASVPINTDTEPQSTVTDAQTQEPIILPESAYAYKLTKTDKHGTQSGKNVVIIQIPGLGCGIIDNSYKNVELTPNINALLKESVYFPNNISASADVTSLDFVLNNSLYAPEYDSALSVYANTELYGLPQLLAEQGYKTISVALEKNGFGNNFGYTKSISVPVDDISKTSVYEKALNEIKSTDGKFYAVVTDINTVYPYFNIDNSVINVSKISGSARVASYLKAVNKTDSQIGEFISGLKAAGLYDNTVIVITGTGETVSADDNTDVKGMTTLCGEYNLDDQIKAPILLKLPGIAHTVCENLTSHTDFMPTMVDLMGLEDKNIVFVGENLFTSARKELAFQSVLLRGSFIDTERIVSADEKGVGRTSVSFNLSTGKTGTAGSSNSKIKANIAYFEEYDKLMNNAIIAKAKNEGREKALIYFEENKDKMEKTISYSVADTFPANESNDFYKNDTKLFNKSVMVSANEFNGAFISTMFKNDGITLIPNAKTGSFISDDISLDGSFTEMVASWNAYTTGGTVEVFVSIKKDDGTYSDWFSWGVWSAISGVSGSKSSENADGEIEIDTLTLKKECSGTIRYRIDFVKTGEEAPAVFNVTFACNKSSGKLNAPTVKSVKLTVNKRYQYDVPEIGGRICSPTSLSMALDYWGESGFETADTAAGVYDNKEDIYGNWSYNVAWAGELGYNAYLDYYDIDAMRNALSKNVPVICSVRVVKGQLSQSGFPNYSTSGHLLCAIGYETDSEGKLWIIINDPASVGVEIKVLATEFESIWRGMAYIVQPHPDRYTWRIGEGTDRDILVVADYIPEGRYNRPGGKYRVRYIVIHNTGNFAVGATALSHRNYIKQSGTETSWHYTVDDVSIYKHLPEEEKAWHAGDGRDGKGNTYGIGIEICNNHETLGTKRPTAYFKDACSNATSLVAELMYKYNLKISAVQQHNYFSGKNCPQVIRENDMWDDFLAEVQMRYDAIVASRGEK